MESRPFVYRSRLFCEDRLLKTCVRVDEAFKFNGLVCCELDAQAISGSLMTGESAPKKRLVRIGIDDAPPIPMQMGDPALGTFRGYEVDLLEALAEQLGCRHGISAGMVEFDH